MSKKNIRDSQNHLFLNSAIGFLGVLLFILLAALGARLLYPRIVAERSDIDQALVSNVIQLEVLNGCGIPGIATRFTDSLREYGFDVVETGNFDHFDVSKSFVVARNDQIENARRVANAIGISDQQVLIEASPNFYLDVTLIIGSDFESLKL